MSTDVQSKQEKSSTQPKFYTANAVLVVDDVLMNLDVLSSVLERHDYIPLTATNGEKALEIAMQQRPEVILLDINMPNMTGFEVCERLKADERTREIPVIFISALDDTDNIVRGFDVGGVDYITKPFQFREVIARVEGQLMLFRQKRQLQELRDREKQHFSMLDQMRRQFIGSATHDLKNPLFVIGGYVELLAGLPGVSKDPDAPDYLDSIRRGLEKMRSLVYDMLELLQLETNPELNQKEISLADFLLSESDDLGATVQNRDLSFDVSIPQEEVTISIDSLQMARVLENLVSNAVKYTPDGGRVVVSGYARDNSAVIEVQDTGLGIPEDSLPKLFIPFERVKNPDHLQRDGTGLGLSIVKAIVERHNGHIEVESTLGEGSTFRVILPTA